MYLGKVEKKASFQRNFKITILLLFSVLLLTSSNTCLVPWWASSAH